MARVNRTTARHFLIGVVGLVVLAAVGAVGAVVSSGGALPARQYTYATAAFHQSGTLAVRQDVRINSLIVGQISDIEYQNGEAVVTLRMNGEHPVYANASAQIWQESALARSFVELNPGDPSAGPLPGNRIPSTRTTDAPDLDQLFNIFDQPTRTALSGTLTQLGGGLLGHSEDLRDALQKAPPGLDDLGQVADTLDDPQTHLPALLTTADRVVGRLDSRSAQLRSLVQQTDQTLAAVNADSDQPLDATLKDLPSTLAHARQALDSLDGPLGDARQAVTTIRPGAQALGASTDDLRGVLREAVTPLDKVPAVADKATPAVKDLTQTVSNARPLVPRLLNTLASTQELTAELSPYSPDIGRFFAQLAAPHGLLSGSISPTEHYFGIFPTVPGGAGLLSVPDPTFHENPYPAPGETAYRTNPDGSPKATGAAQQKADR